MNAQSCIASVIHAQLNYTSSPNLNFRKLKPMPDPSHSVICAGDRPCTNAYISVRIHFRVLAEFIMPACFKTLWLWQVSNATNAWTSRSKIRLSSGTTCPGESRAAVWGERPRQLAHVLVVRNTCSLSCPAAAQRSESKRRETLPLSNAITAQKSETYSELSVSSVSAASHVCLQSLDSCRRRVVM
ncbi:hypothetical protein EJ03DRAFT_323550 [Teratosphaeria nubilosa]|uniref:Uncharacterized protein n=1 Tax=Teratosphaeria nubilosa TaxID=161662 RepID=A0A6G1LL56_9PEZI|nr:hypothetical protein EJ03DRAFT_323550 [Teratosphaeria nubilosa]